MPKISYLDRSEIHSCIDCGQPLKTNVLRRKNKLVSRCYVCFHLFNGIKEIRHFKNTPNGKVPAGITNFVDKQKIYRVQYSYGLLLRNKR